MEQTETVPSVDPIDAIKGILGGDDVQPSESQSEDDRPEVQAADDGGDDSGASPVHGEESAPADGLPEAAEGGEAEVDAPVTLKELAAHLELEPGDVYEVEIPLGKGESVTLGEMKDAFKEYGDVHEYRKKVETRESDMERDLLATRAHLNRVLAMIPPENAQQIISHADQATKAWQREQKDLVLETIPAWRDDAVRLADRQAINEHGAEYGFSVEEMEYTHDARMLRYMHDFAKLKQEVAEMRTGAKKKTVSADAPRRRAGATKQRKLAQAIRRARESTNVSDKRAVVSQLITGG